MTAGTTAAAAPAEAVSPLAVQDASQVDPTKLTALSPEVVSLCSSV
jgi:hypothetical protein